MIQDDFELTSKDVQDLANRNAIASFFASLGYDTNDRLEQNVSAMGFTSDLLKSSIKYIERLASEDGGLLEVYLLELKSVTVSVTHALARAFRNSSVQVPLLILTDDYQRLDFVLVERYSAPTNVVQEPLAGFPPATPRQVIVRPRVLTVQRHQPGKVELRVLRHFSYTEGDSFAQYDKLLSAYIVAEWSEPYFNNRALFSDHYLTQRLPESPEWGNQANATQMTRAYRELRALYEDARETFATVPASKVRAELIGPALELLGFSLQQVPQNTETVEPTYYLTDQKQASGQPPLVVCLAYSWGRSLDGKDEQRDQERPDENPGAVVVSLL
ncbi:MAG TPA: hypothetical protein VFV38_12240, partial [Ktedonobacteraceae bacterium]|nr:hypothetical protein [Ktedonobacteraceae bacterium]